MTPDQAAHYRSLLLGRSQDAALARELWSCSAGTYTAYRECIITRKQQAAAAAAAALREAASLGGGGSRGGAGLQALPATVKYSFEGVKHVLAEASAAVTALAFACLRNDMLAYGCADGELWLMCLPAAPQAPPSCFKARKMHAQAVLALDWAYDNSQLLSVGHDGSLCVWEAGAEAEAGAGPGPAGLTCIRSISVHTTAFLCGRFHRVNFSLALVGTSAGCVEAYNCSTGMLHSRYPVGSPGSGLQVTALDCSNHHIFVGDSSGQLHMYSCEMHERQLSRLRPTGRLRLSAPGAPPSPVTALQYVPFCRATDTPVLMAALQDGSLCIVRANEARHTADLYLRRAVPSPSAAAATHAPLPSSRSPSFSGRSSLFSASATAGAPAGGAAEGAAAAAALLRLCPAICPLSAISGVPLITYGSADTAVYIVDVTARSFSAGASRGGGGGGGGGGVAGAAAAATADRPVTVTALKAHRLPVTVVAWSYDDVLLASADAGGTVVLWQRCRLF